MHLLDLSLKPWLPSCLNVSEYLTILSNVDREYRFLLWAMHQGAFLGANWSARRKQQSTIRHKNTVTAAQSTNNDVTSTNPGQWNVQVVRGKVTSRCLWNACKALSLGLILMVLGCTMATIGYFANQLSERIEIRGNETVLIKNESRGFHLNNLSYAGPIVMGVGGFIVVAACVMTFEARDSAAKVVPARLKASAKLTGATSPSLRRGPMHQLSQRSNDSTARRSASSQTRWDNQMGLYNQSTSPITGRRALTAAFMHFSRGLEASVLVGDKASIAALTIGPSTSISNTAAINKSPSAPDLIANLGVSNSVNSSPGGTRIAVVSGITGTSNGRGSKLRRHHKHNFQYQNNQPLNVSPNSLHPCSLLSPSLLQRQAVSMDNPTYDGEFTPPFGAHPYMSKESLEMGVNRSLGARGSQGSMTLDLHVPNEGHVTLRIRDQSRRSDTAKRHQFLRQRRVEEGEGPPYRDTNSCSPRLPGGGSSISVGGGTAPPGTLANRRLSRSRGNSPYGSRHSCRHRAQASVGSSRRSSCHHQPRQNIHQQRSFELCSSTQATIHQPRSFELPNHQHPSGHQVMVHQRSFDIHPPYSTTSTLNINYQNQRLSPESHHQGSSFESAHSAGSSMGHSDSRAPSLDTSDRYCIISEEEKEFATAATSLEGELEISANERERDNQLTEDTIQNDSPS